MCEIPALFTRIDSGPCAASWLNVSLTMFLVSNVTGAGRCFSSCRNNLPASLFPGAETHIQDPHRGPVGGKLQGNRLSDAAAPAGHQGNFAVESEIGIALRLTQSETPLFHGMKSF